MKADDSDSLFRSRIWRIAPMAAGFGLLVWGIVAYWYWVASAALYLAAGGAAVIVAEVTVRMRRSWGSAFVPVAILAVLPAWGLFYNQMAEAKCRISSCAAGDTVFRPLAAPGVYGLVALHLVTVLAYAVSRRRPAALRAGAEALVHALLIVGVLVHVLVGVHFARWLPAAVLFPFLFLPCAAPVATAALYGVELYDRLRRRGVEAAIRPATTVGDTAYREGPPQEPLPPDPRIDRPTLARALAMAPAILGVHAVAHAVWLGRADGALRVLTGTCGHVLSSIPIEVVPSKCHYLCTVAARGHAWVVKPERLGRRGGVTIVVNRQLALANAFEDLLHERWPRFGRWARRTYDRLGLPVSRYLHRPLLADLTYLAMKPAEWAFYTALLLLDPGDPEGRIERMYQA
jgi:hypothetical protein